MVVLETNRIILRRLQLSDAAALETIFGDADVMRFGDGVQSPEWIRRWLSDRIAEYEKRDGIGPWAVLEKSRTEPIGYCGLFFYPDVNGRAETEIGYRLARQNWGRGYATEAVIAVRDHAFEMLGMTRLIAIIDPNNTASIRVAEKAGFRHESEVMFPGYTHPDRVYVLENRYAEREPNAQ